MTLHWWMHWFWVTALLVVYVSSGGSAAPQSEELQHITDVEHTERAGRALYFPKNNPSTAKPGPDNTTGNATAAPYEATEDITTSQELEQASSLHATNQTEIVHPTIQWTPVNATDETNHSIEVIPKENTTNTFNVTVIPVQPNSTDSQNVTRRRNSIKPDLVKEEASLQEAFSESKIVTEKPLSLETQTLLQTRIPSNIDLYRRLPDNNEGGMDMGAIAGISFAALVLAALAGSTALVLYRRRLLNKPQTLHDKCSNPDSSGYLDDSTVRDNSEEMYSLDNDSFLNSLEAMTIQNYWTDTVKHTKL